MGSIALQTLRSCIVLGESTVHKDELELMRLLTNKEVIAKLRVMKGRFSRIANGEFKGFRHSQSFV
jgi:hypothetical protein